MWASREYRGAFAAQSVHRFIAVFRQAHTSGESPSGSEKQVAKAVQDVHASLLEMGLWAPCETVEFSLGRMGAKVAPEYLAEPVLQLRGIRRAETRTLVKVLEMRR
jgi:hypothetical protein